MHVNIPHSVIARLLRSTWSPWGEDTRGLVLHGQWSRSKLSCNNGCHSSLHLLLKPPIVERSTTMSSHIKFAEPTSNKASKDRARGLSQEKGSAQRAPSPGNEIVYPTGWRLVLTTTGYVLNQVPSGVAWRKLTIYRLLIGFFLSNLDVTIVSSALTGITDDLQGFEKRSWIITGYLATYTGMIWNAILYWFLFPWIDLFFSNISILK